MMVELDLNLLLPPGKIIYSNAGTIIDLVWGSNEVANYVIKCRVTEDHDHDSDHPSNRNHNGNTD